MKKSFNLNATTMRYLLALSVVAFLTLVSVVFYLTQTNLANIAQAVKSSGNTNSGKARLIMYNSQTFSQQIKQDLDRYAAGSGLLVKSINPITDQQSGTNNLNLTELQTKSFQVSIEGSIPYFNFLKLTKAIESNLPIIRITNLKISRDKNKATNIIVDKLIISTSIGQTT